MSIQGIQNATIIIQLFAQCHSHPTALWDPYLSPEKYGDPLTSQTVLAYLSSGEPFSLTVLKQYLTRAKPSIA